jgi:hypothetical protein
MTHGAKPNAFSCILPHVCMHVQSWKSMEHMYACMFEVGGVWSNTIVVVSSFVLREFIGGASRF